jgi:hypothetical protein
MIYTRTLTPAEELLLKGEGFSAEYCINNAIDYIIRVEREKREPEAVKSVVDGLVPMPAVMNRDNVLVEYLKSSEYKTVNEIVAERDIDGADKEAISLQEEIDAETNPAKKTEKQAEKAAAISRKAEKEVELVAARAEKAALVAEL